MYFFHILIVNQYIHSFVIMEIKDAINGSFVGIDIFFTYRLLIPSIPMNMPVINNKNDNIILATFSIFRDHIDGFYLIFY